MTCRPGQTQFNPLSFARLREQPTGEPQPGSILAFHVRRTKDPWTMPTTNIVIPSLAALLISLSGGPAMAMPVQYLDREPPPAAEAPPAPPAAEVEQAGQGGSATWEVRLEAHGGYGGVTNLSASTGGVQVHGAAAGGAMVVTWPLSGLVHGGVRLGGFAAWDMTGESFHRDESGAPARTNAYGFQAAFQGEVRGRRLTFRFAPGLGVLHMHTEEQPSREYARPATHDTTSPELTLTVGLDLNLHRHVALCISAEVGTLLVRTRGNLLGGIAFRF